MVRIPTYSIIKKVEIMLENDGASITTFTLSAGLYWSDNSNDGTPTLKVGSATAVSSACFAFQLDMSTYKNATNNGGAGGAGKSQWTDITFANSSGNSVTDGYYRAGASNMPIWLALSSGEQVPPAYDNLNQPKTNFSGLQTGTGYISSTSNDWYGLTQDPGGYVDICLNPTTANNLASAKNVCVRATIVIPGA
jgi:hypothetical protein